MIDVHSHVLPGIDDGTKAVEEAVALCRLARERGTQVLVATPHHKPGSFSNPRDFVLENIERLQKQLDLQGVALKLAPGTEIFVDSGLPERIRAGEVLTYGDARRYILLEFSFQQYPMNPEDLIFRLRLASVTPVIAHPERIRYFQEDIGRLESLVRQGALSQITSSSLMGTFGSRVQAITEAMLRRRLAHFVASDCHDLSYRPPGLQESLARAEAIVGAEAAGKMVIENPAALLEGRPIKAEEPVPESEERARTARGRRGFLGWLRRGSP